MTNYKSENNMQESVETSIQLKKTDTQAVWMLYVPDCAPVFVHRHTCGYGAPATPPERRGPHLWFAEPIKTLGFSVYRNESNCRCRRRSNRCLEMRRQVLRCCAKRWRPSRRQAIICSRSSPFCSIPKLIFLEQGDCEREHFDVQIVSLPLINTQQIRSDQQPGLIEWMGEVFHWNASLVIQLAELFRKRSFSTCCSNRIHYAVNHISHSASVECSLVTPQKLDHSHSPSVEHHERMASDEDASTANGSTGEHHVKTKKAGRSFSATKITKRSMK